MNLLPLIFQQFINVNLVIIWAKCNHYNQEKANYIGRKKNTDIIPKKREKNLFSIISDISLQPNKS